MAALMLAVMAQVMLAGTSHVASDATGAAEVLSSQHRCPHMPTTCCGQMVLRSRHTLTLCSALDGGAVGSRCLPSWSDGNAWLAPPWRAEACHICSNSTAAAARASEQIAAHSSLLPPLSTCTLTSRVRSLLRCVGPLQCGGVASERRRAEEKATTLADHKSSKRQKLKTTAMSYSSVLNRMVVCLCVCDLWLGRTGVTRRA